MRLLFLAGVVTLALGACAAQPKAQGEAQPQAADTANAEDASPGCVPSTGSRVKRPCTGDNGAVRQGSTVRKTGSN
jgi:hypothetical protein